MSEPASGKELRTEYRACNLCEAICGLTFKLDGNTIISNYLPGPFLGKQPQAFEVTREKQVVWEFTDHARFKTVNQICVLDGSGGRAGTELR